MQDYEQAIGLNPGNANAYNNRGVIYRIKRQYGRAIADYDEAIWLKNGNFPAACYNRALAYADKGEYEKSLKDDVVLRFMTLIGLNNLGCRGYVLGATLEWCRQYSDIAIHELMTPTATTTNPMYQRGYELDLDQ